MSPLFDWRQVGIKPHSQGAFVMAAKKTTSTPKPAKSAGGSRRRKVLQPAATGAAQTTEPELLRRLAEAIRPMLAAGGPAGAPEQVALAARVTAPSRSMFGAQVQAPAGSEVGALEAMPFSIDTSMDPRLQLAIANRRSGKPGLELRSTASDEHPVVARVTSTDAWVASTHVLPGAILGKTEDGSWVVTGRVPISRLEDVHGDTNVLSLKSSQVIVPQLAATLDAMGVAVGSLPTGVEPGGGNGVVIGIVDFGCDFAHGNFRRADGSTRLLALWNQAGITRPDSPFGFGRLHLPAEINAALATANPYATLGYGPRPDSAFQTGTHGTHVMDIAAGNGGGSGQPGVAPQADIVFVEASITDIAGQGPAAVAKSFGDSVQLLEAVRFIFDFVGDRPCVVNLSLGTNGGPHDGTSLVEQGLDAIVSEKPNRAVVIAASNSQEDGIHVSGRVPANGAHDIVWTQSNQGGGEVELWYTGARRLRVSLVAPDGTIFGPVVPGENLPIGTPGQIAIFISNRLDDPNNHDNVIGVWVADGLPGANWTLRLQSLDGQAVTYHAWIERNDGAQASFVAPVLTHTLGSISTGQLSVAVGSFDAHKPAFPLSGFSSSGPTRDGREKPELSAPGHAVLAAHSRTGDGVTRKSGTSMAAPAVSGLVALILAEARRNGRDLSIAELRNRLIAGVRRNPPALVGNAWDPRYGRGRASSASIVENIV
jgi:subtilisin family serine protease